MTEKIRFTRMRLLESISYMLGLLNNIELKRSRDFSYFLNRNTRMLSNHFDAASAIHKGTRSPEYEQYQKGIEAIHNKWAERKENGEIIRSSSRWPICKNSKARDEEAQEWYNKHKDMIIAFETQLNEAMEILNVEEEYEIYPIELEKVPEDIDISPMDMFIKENLDLYKPKAPEPVETPKEEPKQE